MINKKLSGSFYTPKLVADFLVSHLVKKFDDRQSISVLEPSAGDGIFIRTIYNEPAIAKKIKTIVAVEKNGTELNKIIKDVKQPSLKAIHSDFLDFQNGNRRTFGLVIGNPPYIRKGLLKKKQLEMCVDIHARANLAAIKTKNIWTAFLVRCIEFTEENGILAFVLPSELLQVKFAAELRDLIIKEFERVEIFTFNELLFNDCKGQDTLILIAERKSNSKGIYYCNIDKSSDLDKGKFTLAQNAKIKESKWTHHHLETDEIELLEKLKNQIKTVNDYSTSKAGIVTAANDYFIVDEKTVEEYSLHDFIRPIIKKGLFVNGSVELSANDFQLLVDQSKPAYLIALNQNSAIRKNAKLWSYLKIGEEKDIPNRYKTSIRDNWYEVPNIGSEPEAFFFKRCNEYPKLIKNSAKVLATDSAYVISMKEGYAIENLIYSFYNSLTLSFAELQGRYYGGGVLELTPNEFKQLPIPFALIAPKRFQDYVDEFKSKKSIKEVCKEYDSFILKTIDKNLDSDNILKLFNIREKLYMRRVKAH